MEDLKTIVSKNIIHLRANSKMTQFELGEALSYSDKAVSKWERGEAIPDAYVLKKLSALFNVTVDYLLSGHDEDELKTVKSYRFDHRIILSIAFFGIWTLAIITFAMFWFFERLQWLVLIYATPISFLAMLILSAVWSQRKANVFFISMLVWSVITAVYFTFIQYNWWLLFLVGIPAQVIILLAFKVRIVPKK